MSPIENLPEGLIGAAREAENRKLELARQQAVSPLSPDLPVEIVAAQLQQRLTEIQLTQATTQPVMEDVHNHLAQLEPLLSDIASDLRALGLTPAEIDAVAIAAIGAPSKNESPSPPIADNRDMLYTSQDAMELTGLKMKTSKLFDRLKNSGYLEAERDYQGKGKKLRYTPAAIEKLRLLKEEADRRGAKNITDNIINTVSSTIQKTD